MIFNAFYNILSSLLNLIFSTFVFPNLDFSAITTLQNVTGFGVYILGQSVIGAYFASILFWFGVRFFINLIGYIASIIH